MHNKRPALKMEPAAAFKMSAEDRSVEAAAEAPHDNQQAPTTTTNNTTPQTTPIPTTTIPNTMKTYTDELTALQPNGIRLLYCNVNGLKTDCSAELENTLVAFLKQEPTILGLIETQRNWKNYENTAEPLRKHINAHQRTKTTKIAMSHCNEEHTTKKIYQPGGVAQVTLKPIQNRVQAVGSDDMGRWAWQEIRLDGTRKLYVMTAYRTCDEPTGSTALTTAWHQQYRRLRKRGIDKPDPRTQFYTDLKRFIKQHQREGHLFIIGMDANAAHDDDEVLDFMCETELIDVFDDFVAHPRPPTYARGTKQIDHLMSSIDLLQYWTNAFIMNPNFGPGDHSTFGGDLNFGALINSTDLRKIDPTNEQSRTLGSTDVKARKTFLADLKQQLIEQNVFQRMQCLIDRCERTNRCTPDDERIYQELCDQLYETALRAEKHCKRTGPRPWSTPLQQAGKAVQYARKEFYRLVRGGRPHI